MLTIRNEQLEVIARSQLRRWIAEYLASCYPRQVAQSNSSLIAVLDEGLKWCDARLLRDAVSIRKYAHVSFVLGLDFQQNPKCKWAHHILGSEEWSDLEERIAVLEEAMVDRLRTGALFA